MEPAVHDEEETEKEPFLARLIAGTFLDAGTKKLPRHQGNSLDMVHVILRNVLD